MWSRAFVLTAWTMGIAAPAWAAAPQDENDDIRLELVAHRAYTQYKTPRINTTTVVTNKSGRPIQFRGCSGEAADEKSIFYKSVSGRESLQLAAGATGKVATTFEAKNVAGAVDRSGGRRFEFTFNCRYLLSNGNQFGDETKVTFTFNPQESGNAAYDDPATVGKGIGDTLSDSSMSNKDKAQALTGQIFGVLGSGLKRLTKDSSGTSASVDEQQAGDAEVVEPQPKGE